jgi:uncharacterized membrane protein
MQRNVDTWERVVSLAAGAALIALAARSRRWRSIAASSGAGLIGRGLTGFCPVKRAIGRGRTLDDTRSALSGARGVNVDERITIARRPEEVFEFWRDLANLPRFLSHLERIDVIDGRRSHWVVQGPAGIHVEWDAELINEIRPDLLAWRSLPGADVASAGSVQFRPLGPSETELRVRMQYAPPAGRAGAAVARWLGDSPESMLRTDLRRLKSILEAA